MDDAPLPEENSSEILEIVSSIIETLPNEEQDLPENSTEKSEMLNYVMDSLSYGELDTTEKLGIISFILNNLPYDELGPFNLTTNDFQSHNNGGIVLDCSADGYPNNPILKSWHHIWEDRLHISKFIQRHTGKAICEMLLNFPTGVSEQNNSTLQNLLDYAKCLSSQDALVEKQTTFLEFINDLIDCYVNRAKKAEKKKMLRRKNDTGVPNYIHLDNMGDRNCKKEQRTWIDSTYVIKNCKNQTHKVVQYFPGIDELNITGRSMTIRTQNKYK